MTSLLNDHPLKTSRCCHTSNFNIHRTENKQKFQFALVRLNEKKKTIKSTLRQRRAHDN